MRFVVNTIFAVILLATALTPLLAQAGDLDDLLLDRQEPQMSFTAAYFDSGMCLLSPLGCDGQDARACPECDMFQGCTAECSQHAREEDRQRCLQCLGDLTACRDTFGCPTNSGGGGL